jgi:hypothetical protein
MSFASISAVLDSMAARIEALVPSSQDAADDVFRVSIRPATDSVGGRAVHLLAQAGIRKTGSNRLCKAWEAQVEVIAYYTDQPTEEGRATVYQRALTDAEAILADLYDWSATNDSIDRIDPSPGDVQADGQGEIIATRTIQIEYQRT